jgi:16S rRNA processing protein RimM
MAAPELALVGRIRKPHGIRGEVVVEPVTDAPEAIFASGRRLFVGTEDGAPLSARDAEGARTDGAHGIVTIERARGVDGAWLVKLEGIADRNAAERWRGRGLLLPLAELPAPAEDEIYYHDLVGMRVVLADDTPVGEVVALYELPQGLVLEVARAGRGAALVPWQPRIVSEVDVDAGVVRITPPDGLLDD